ncbi:MAG: energy-coupling factor transporter ATPase [Clostridia bacterium]|nr:energy-coupling factor transporter ATPase [Clostridia bacterium]
MEKIIEYKDVTFRYEGEDEAHILPLTINGVTLNLEKGSFVAVLGRNGSGKSTLAKLTNAIHLPESGQVLVEGLDTRDEKNTDLIRRKVGMVFQNPDNQIVATIVEDDVAFGPENLGIEPKEIRRRVDDALKAVGMYDFRLAEPHKLSGGQKQRVAIAGILAMQTDSIVLDEPTAMLDPIGRREVLSTVLRLNRERGITVLMITHFMEEAAQAERVIVLDKGKVFLDGSPRDVFTQSEALKRCGLDVPQATGLAKALADSGIKIKTDVLNEEECIDAILTAYKE